MLSFFLGQPASLLLLLLSASLARASLQIVPGATWTGTNTDAHIQAHGAGVFVEDGVYYLIGEDHTDGSAFQNINCYSSTDLVSWTYVGALLSQTSSGDLGPDRVVERPKVIYNSSTGKYVLWLHIDDSSYAEAKVGVATGTSVCGKYDYLGSWQPLGYQSRDIGLFQDDDGTAYLLTEDRVNGLRIDSLTSDYLNVSAAVYLFADYEAPAMLKQNGYYYLFASHLSGWDPNDNEYVYATDIAGPWSSWTTFATVGTDTYSSQTNYILPVSSDLTMYLGDRWVSTNLMASTYVWLPLTISGTSVTMADQVNWIPNVASGGDWTEGPSETWPEGEDATLTDGATVVTCSGCSGGEAAGYIGGPDDGTVTFTGVESDATTKTTIRIKYENGDSTQRFANVSCNGVEQNIAFLPTADGNTPGSSVVTCGLTTGSSNTVVITQTDGTYGPDVDRIMVPLS
ncbi:family 43 glycoside hydrolase [Cryphonectria parasitica EP155]|uniref:Family 43 glycoside hydrolase n=1 Tax=Cryphonectria parasitica (strain ATCC 38755 / EP155) TaxID=660469 RepID=A0A9P5CKA4_CRYP1|nr:family 43 glycoside hydrolase [Cryphonectria parasitica EP155]KAF3760746.1 family 43 glycoside hydrolase [Cryphonectria parasitica EP155]